MWSDFEIEKLAKRAESVGEKEVRKIENVMGGLG